MELLSYEMVWMIRWFEWAETTWQRRHDDVDPENRAAAGLRSYAAKQISMWRQFGDQADTKFRQAIPGYVSSRYSGLWGNTV